MNPWLWPDHVIGKRESRRLREEHNALVNAHAAIVGKSVQFVRYIVQVSHDGETWSGHPLDNSTYAEREYALAIYRDALTLKPHLAASYRLIKRVTIVTEEVIQ